jgi:hypothetical protein
MLLDQSNISPKNIKMAATWDSDDDPEIRTQEIAVASEPRRGPWGRYVLGRADADGTLPYDVRLGSLAPVRGCCNCADFLRGALGLCKHLLAVQEHLAKKPRDWGQMMKESPVLSPASARCSGDCSMERPIRFNSIVQAPSGRSLNGWPRSPLPGKPPPR